MTVDEYVARAPAFARPIIEYCRSIARAEGLEEQIKWRIPFFVRGAPIFGVAAFTAHCRVAFWKSNVVFARATSVDELPTRSKFAELIRKEEASGPRPKSDLGRKAPDDLVDAVSKNARASKTWEGFPPSHRRDYSVWVLSAKTPATRSKRIAESVKLMAQGKSRLWKYGK